MNSKTVLFQPTTWRVGLALVSLGLSLSANAELGGSVATVTADHLFIKAATPIRLAAKKAYTIHEIESPYRTTVREYVSAEGRVFAVTWQGAHVPNLQQLLGSYFEQYATAALEARSKIPGRHPINIQAPGLIVQTSGHTQAFSGRAVASDLVPPDITLEEIQ